MNHHALRSSSISFLVIAVSGALACSATDGSGSNGSGGSSASGGGFGSGGAGSGGADGLGSGGNGTGTGGDSTSATGGGTATGGTNGGGKAFTCPTGYDGMTPTLAGVMASPVATAPNPTFDGMVTDQVFLEGPVWIDGALYVSQLRKWGDQPPARILKLNGSTLEEFIGDSGTNGLAVRNDGKLVTANHKAFGIVEFPVMAGATGTPIVTEYQSKGFNSPNDLTLRDDGNIYFTDPDYQCGSNCPQGSEKHVYRVSPEGVVSVIPSAHGQPNGIALSPDQNTLYVGGDATMQSYPIMADGSVGAAANFGSSTGVDGLAVDCAGNIYASVHSQQKIDVYKPDGNPVGSLTVGGNVTNAAFGGPENKTLYVTRYDSDVVSFALDIPGFPY